MGKTAAEELDVGWKISPAVIIKSKSEHIIADIDGEGSIRHMWMTCTPDKWRSLLIKIYWDDCEHPSVYVPLGDFFATAGANGPT